MEDTKRYCEDLCCMMDELIEAAKHEFSNGVQNVNTQEMGAVIDMIKDLAEAKEKLYKACYYKSIVKAMKEESAIMDGMDFDGEEGEVEGYRRGSNRRGYDHWRYSSGRFAPAGRGHYSSGYRPMMPETVDPYMYDEPWGYTSSQSGSQNGSTSMGNSATTGGGSRMGYPMSPRGQHYEKYNQARMGYHESHDAKSKERMDASAQEYLVDTVEAIREVWKDADPAMRKEIKNRFAGLMSEMG